MEYNKVVEKYVEEFKKKIEEKYEWEFKMIWQDDTLCVISQYVNFSFMLKDDIRNNISVDDLNTYIDHPELLDDSDYDNGFIDAFVCFHIFVLADVAANIIIDTVDWNFDVDRNSSVFAIENDELLFDNDAKDWYKRYLAKTIEEVAGFNREQERFLISSNPESKWTN